MKIELFDIAMIVGVIGGVLYAVWAHKKGIKHKFV